MTKSSQAAPSSSAADAPPTTEPTTNPTATPADEPGSPDTAASPPPSPLISSPVSDSAADNPVEVIGTASPDHTVTLYDGNVEIGSMQAGPDGSWGWTGPLSAGPHAVWAAQISPPPDALESSSSPVVAFTVTDAPASEGRHAAPGEPASTPSPTDARARLVTVATKFLADSHYRRDYRLGELRAALEGFLAAESAA